MHQGVPPSDLILSESSVSGGRRLRHLVALVLELGHRVPDEALDGHPHRDAVDLLLERGRLEEARDDGLAHRLEVDRLLERHDCALLGEVEHEARLREERDVGRVVPADAAPDQRRQVVRRRVLHVDPRLLLEVGDRLVEELLLVAAEGAEDRHRAAELSVGAARPVVAAASGGDDRQDATRAASANPVLRFLIVPPRPVPTMGDQ